MKLTIGAVGLPGTSLQQKTGSWRTTHRPLFKQSKCTGCHLCLLLCPDGSVYREDKNRYYVDLDYCKGCGICARICPVKDIEMVSEV